MPLLSQMSVWGKGSISAVKAPPPPSSLLAAAAAAASNPRVSNTTTGRGAGASGGSNNKSGSGGGGRKGDQKSHNKHDTAGNKNKQQVGGKHYASKPSNTNNTNNKTPSSSSNKRPPRASTKSLDEIELLMMNDSTSVVKRISASQFLSCRMQFLDPPHSEIISEETSWWTPHTMAHWVDSNRAESIQNQMDLMFNFQPLQVNSETRWKPKVQQKGDAKTVEEEDEQLRQAFSILNKLSWTNLDKLAVQFLQALGVSSSSQAEEAVLSKDAIVKIMTLIVNKAMLEPHFCELYAKFSLKLTGVHKAFRRALLDLCQAMFHQSDVMPEFPADMAPADRELEEIKARRKSIGLMQFIGELYHVGVIKGEIMIACLERLLQPDDEERLDCFCKLMTTIGSRLHDDKTDTEQAMQDLWKQVYSMAGKPMENGDVIVDGPVAPSVRVKFLLQDLIELKDNNWKHRRKQEKAKSLKEIHKEVAQEEAATQRRLSHGAGSARKVTLSMTRSQSTGGVASILSAASVPVTPDEDGFVSVAKPKKSSIRRSASDGVQNHSKNKQQQQTSSSGPRSSLQMAMEGKTTSRKSTATTSSSPKTTSSAVSVTATPPIKEFLELDECSKRGKSLLKECLVSGDLDDAVLTMDEIVGVGNDDHVERGAAVVKATVLLVMEMKHEDVDKLLDVFERCIKDGKISKESLQTGLKDPIDILRDIEIDAPLAAKHLAKIVANWMGLGSVSLDLLLTASDYFLAECRPAELACMVLANRGSDVTDAEQATVEKLMSADDKAAHLSVKDWVASLRH
jgi:translation initiation factor 4G